MKLAEDTVLPRAFSENPLPTSLEELRVAAGNSERSRKNPPNFYFPYD
jgi:hypothetical protein